MSSTRTLSSTTCALALIAGAMSVPSAALAARDDAKGRAVSCEGLSGLNLPGAASITARLVDAGNFSAPDGTVLTDLPRFCQVSIVVDPAINIEVWLPAENWNRRFKGVGGGGYAGTISWTALGGALRDGYATASTDTGHAGIRVPTREGDFAFNPDGSLNWGLIEDFASHSLFEMTAKGKTVTGAFYGKKPRYSYWMGCSTGGRQGLMQVQRTPYAYDGVLAGAPAINWERFIAAELWPQVVMREEAGGPVEVATLQRANDAALAACDHLDGVVDGQLEDPRACKYDPRSDNAGGALTDAEAEAVYRIWDGARRDRDGEKLWPGLERTALFDGLAGPVVFPIASNTVFGGGHLQWTMEDQSFDWTTLGGYAGFGPYFDESHVKFDAVIGTDVADLRPFRKAGGKLIIWHGWTDQLIYPQGTTGYYERVVDAVGGLEKTKKFARLFMVPGLNHCQGGINDAPVSFGQRADDRASTRPLAEDARHDIFEALVRWVEKGRAPEKIIAAKYLDDDPSQGVVRTRPLCVYPKVAVYDGTGSIDEASSFSCRNPGGGHGHGRKGR